jgi:hypothetical protein
MRADKPVAYYQVSTARQGASGLGLDARRQAVATFLCRQTVVAEFKETESGKRADRPELTRAISACRLYGGSLCDRPTPNSRYDLQNISVGTQTDKLIPQSCVLGVYTLDVGGRLP